MLAHLPILRSERLLQFVKFCVVGGSGFLVDMSLLYMLADPRCLGWNVAISKFCAAEIAMVSNFTWNEFWTFRRVGNNGTARDRFHRLVTFNAICGIGIGFAIILLHTFHIWLGWNLYVSNVVAIITVTFWNFGMNARFNWKNPTSHSYTHQAGEKQTRQLTKGGQNKCLGSKRAPTPHYRKP